MKAARTYTTLWDMTLIAEQLCGKCMSAAQ
jgi:hypothetical protein